MGNKERNRGRWPRTEGDALALDGRGPHRCWVAGNYMKTAPKPRTVRTATVDSRRPSSISPATAPTRRTVRIVGTQAPTEMAAARTTRRETAHQTKTRRRRRSSFDVSSVMESPRPRTAATGLICPASKYPSAADQSNRPPAIREGRKIFRKTSATGSPGTGGPTCARRRGLPWCSATPSTGRPSTGQGQERSDRCAQDRDAAPRRNAAQA